MLLIRVIFHSLLSFNQVEPLCNIVYLPLFLKFYKKFLLPVYKMFAKITHKNETFIKLTKYQYGNKIHAFFLTKS